MRNTLLPVLVLLTVCLFLPASVLKFSSGAPLPVWLVLLQVRCTLALLRQRFWWSSMEEDTKEFITACLICSQHKNTHQAPFSLLHPLPVPHRPLSHISLDFVTGLPTSDSDTVTLTVIDWFSKTAQHIPLPKLPTTKETTVVMLHHVFRLHGLPSDMVSDRGPQFTSHFWS